MLGSSAASSLVAVGHTRDMLESSHQMGGPLGTQQGGAKHHLKEGRASSTTVAGAHRASCLCHGSSSTTPAPLGMWARPPTCHPHCFPWHSTRSLACTWQCHPLIHDPGEVTHLLQASANHPEVSAGKRCRPRFRDAMGGVADSTGLVFLQNRIAAHFGCAVARTASMLAPKRMCGRRRY